MLLLSCETPISVKLPKSSSTKVIEGWIENGQSPIVVVSNSLDYYSTINVDSIQASVDKDAIVTVTDEYGNTEQLKLGFSFEHIFGLMGAMLCFGYHYRTYLGNVVRSQIIPIIIY